MSDTRSDIEIPPTGLLPESQVDDAHQPEEGERQRTPRELAMERIAAHAEEIRQKEFAQSAIYDQDARDAGLAFAEDEPENPEPEAHQEPLHQPTAPVAAPAAQPQQQQAAPQTFAVEVDGQILHVTPDQLVHLARMGVVANQAIHQYQQQPRQPQQQAAPKPTKPIVDESRIRETVKKIQYGNEDDAAGALTSLISDVVSRAPQAPQFDPVQIANYAANVAHQRTRLETETAIIRQEYSDLFENAVRAQAAAQQVAAIRQRNVSMGQYQSDLDVYREAGNQVRAAFGMPQPGTGTQNETQPASQAASPNIVVRSRGEVERRKREAPRSTSQVIDRRSTAPEAPRPPTMSDVVESMRKQRGQSPMR